MIPFLAEMLSVTRFLPLFVKLSLPPPFSPAVGHRDIRSCAFARFFSPDRSGPSAMRAQKKASFSGRLAAPIAAVSPLICDAAKRGIRRKMPWRGLL